MNVQALVIHNFRCVLIQGKGSMFAWWVNDRHRGIYLYPLDRACGGMKQGGDTEGVFPVLMNLPTYLQCIAWRYQCGGGDGILEKSVFFCLCFVEFVLCPRVLYIREIKTKSEKEILKVTTSARKAVQKAENTSVARSIKACESLRDERAMARRKLASVVSESEGKLKRKASEVEVSNLSDKTCQETECATADMNMANIAVTSRHSTQSQSNPWRIN